MIGVMERLLFGPPRSHPLAGWVCAVPTCRAPLDLAQSVHRHGGLLVCGRCHR